MLGVGFVQAAHDVFGGGRADRPVQGHHEGFLRGSGKRDQQHAEEEDGDPERHVCAEAVWRLYITPDASAVTT